MTRCHKYEHSSDNYVPTGLILGPSRGEFTAFSGREVLLLGSSAETVMKTYNDDSDAITAAAWDQAGSRLALGYRTGKLRILECSGRPCSLLKPIIAIPAHGAVINSIAWSVDRVATGSSDGFLKLWDVKPTTAFTELMSETKLPWKKTADGSIDLKATPGFNAKKFFDKFETCIREAESRTAKARAAH